jgi:hypothetical protein
MLTSRLNWIFALLLYPYAMRRNLRLGIISCRQKNSERRQRQQLRVNHILVDTDRNEIKQLVIERFTDISVIDRPLHFRDGTVPMNDVLLHDVKQIDADFYLQTHSTNPLLQAKTIDRAIEE